MSLDLNFKFPATVPDSEALRQTRDRANIPQQGEEEDISRFVELLASRKARDEDFKHGFLVGWLGAYNHWVSEAPFERSPPIDYQYPTRHGLVPLGRGLGSGPRRYQNLQQLQENHAAPNANLSHVHPRELNFDNLNTRELWGGYEDGVEVACEKGPVGSNCEPGDLSGHYDPNEGSETSNAASGITTKVSMRGGGGKGRRTRNHNPTLSPPPSPPRARRRYPPTPETLLRLKPRSQDNPPTPSPSRDLRKRNPSNSPQPPEVVDVPGAITRVPWEDSTAHARRQAAKNKAWHEENANRKAEKAAEKEVAIEKSKQADAVRNRALLEKVAREEASARKPPFKQTNIVAVNYFVSLT